MSAVTVEGLPGGTGGLRHRLRERMRRLLNRRILSVAMPVLAMTLIGAGLTWQYNEQLRAGREMVVHTQRVILNAQRVQLLEEEAEGAERGFVLTGDDTFLEPFGPALAEIPLAVQRLRTLVQDDAEQTRRLADLELLTTARIAQLTEGVELRRTSGLRAAREVIVRTETRHTDARLRVVLDEIKTAERVLLAARQDRVRSMEQYLIVVGLLTGVLTYLFRQVQKAVRRRRNRRMLA